MLPLLLAPLACQPWVVAPAPSDCAIDPPPPGTVQASWVQCDEQVPLYGEGRPGADVLFATPLFRVIVRGPAAALTLPELGGGTVLDAAAWLRLDLVHEVVPIVGGGWLRDVELSVLDDAVVVGGTVAPLPGREATAAGQWREIRYEADPDEPFLRAEGAEGFWIHPGGDEELYLGLARDSDKVVGAVGEVVDHGGAYEVLGTDALLVSTAYDAWSAVAGAAGIEVAGAARGDDLVLYAAGAVVGRVALDGEALALRVPPEVDAVRVEAVGHTPSRTVRPGPGLDLSVGGDAGLILAPSWEDGREHWFRVQWTASDGRSGRAILPSEGQELPLGAGRFVLAISAGPAFDPWVTTEELAPGEHRELPFALTPRLDPDRFVLATFGRPADRSRDWRGSDVEALFEAAADGASYATFTPVDDVGLAVGDLDGLAPLRARVGVLHRAEGWSIAAWPFASSSRKPLHGAPRFWTGDPRDDAAILWGGPDDARTLLVDLGWLAAVHPSDADPTPELVALSGPGVDLDGFAPWFTWLDAQRLVVPTGPATWVAVDGPRNPGLADIEQGLARGEVVAGTGPLILLRVDGRVPGETLPPATSGGRLSAGGALDPALVAVEVEVRNAGSADRLVIVSDHGELLPLPLDGAPSARLLPRPDRWLAAAVWSSTDPDGTWAITAPVWTRAP